MKGRKAVLCKKDENMAAVMALAKAAAADMAKNDKLDISQLKEMKKLFPNWKEGGNYAQGDVVLVEGELYRVQEDASKEKPGGKGWKKL